MAVRERIEPEAGNVVDMSWDPITRIVGNLGIYTKIDFNQKEVVQCKSTSSVFRGYSVFMKGKDPRDSHFITSRICGICGDNHAVCSQKSTNTRLSWKIVWSKMYSAASPRFTMCSPSGGVLTP